MRISQSDIKIGLNILNSRKVGVSEGKLPKDLLYKVFGSSSVIVCELQTPPYEPIVVFDEGRFQRFKYFRAACRF
jgi:hypothetical protein